MEKKTRHRTEKPEEYSLKANKDLVERINAAIKNDQIEKMRYQNEALYRLLIWHIRQYPEYYEKLDIHDPIELVYILFATKENGFSQKLTERRKYKAKLLERSQRRTNTSLAYTRRMVEKMQELGRERE